MKSIGLVQSSSAPHLFKSVDCQVLLEVHMDDIHACGPTLALRRLGEQIQEKLSVKHVHVFEYGTTAKYQHLRRERIMDETGCYIKPNPKYVEAAAKVLGLEDSKPVGTPLAAGDRGDLEFDEAESPKLNGEQHSICRSVVGALLYLSHDRGDASYAVRLLEKDLCTPNMDSWRRMKRVVRYLYHTRDLATYYPYGDGKPLKDLLVYTDSDWAGDKVTRKSTSCAVLKLGEMTLTLICRGQAVRAQSSAEAEVYAGVMGTKEAIHVQQLLGWTAEPVRIRLRMDAAARSVLCRQGVGRIRHMEVKVLWVQDQVKIGRVLVEKVEGVWNQADLGTKPLDEKTLTRHRESLGLKKLPGASTAVAAVATGWFRKNAKGRLIPMMMAAASSTAAGADDRGLAMTTPPPPGGGSFWMLILMTVLAMFLGGVVGWKLRGWMQSSTKTTKSRNAKTQAQCRYAWDRVEPRFVPLPERDQGCWADYGDTETQGRMIPMDRLMHGRRDL